MKPKADPQYIYNDDAVKKITAYVARRVVDIECCARPAIIVSIGNKAVTRTMKDFRFAQRLIIRYSTTLKN